MFLAGIRAMKVSSDCHDFVNKFVSEVEFITNATFPSFHFSKGCPGSIFRYLNQTSRTIEHSKIVGSQQLLILDDDFY